MAGVSASDLRSALSIPAPSPSAGPSQHDPLLAAQPKERKRKPEGISRELYSLIGDSTPSLQAQFVKPRLKPKPNLGAGSGVKWEWKAFSNPARSDSLKLGHWVKVTAEPDEEYPFAKYNVQPSVYTYSFHEYSRYLGDPEWTKEETDYLFDLMREYDTRFHVVYDRYDYPGGIHRSLEDLKDRYCSVCRKLLRNRPWAGDDASKANLMKSFEFDKEQELMRKKWVASLESRNAEEIAEEETIFIELKRLEQTERRFRRDRDELLRTLLGVESGLPDLPFDDEYPLPVGGSAPADNKNKKKKGQYGYGAVGNGMDVDSPVTSAGPSTISLGQPAPKKPSAKQLAQDALHCIHRADPPTSNLPTTKGHRGAHFRSATIPAIKPAANAAKIMECLQEVGINPARLVMPTRENIALLESVFEAANSLVETKKTVDRVEQEIRTLKIRLGEKDPDGGADAEGSAVATTPRTATPMEVEAGVEAEGEEVREGRAQSVMSSASVRASRIRKKSGRSMSISSVDTSATASTRATTTKRQRKR